MDLVIEAGGVVQYSYAIHPGQQKSRGSRELPSTAALERAETMHRMVSNILALKADAEGVSVYEIYQRYLRDNPRHYQRSAR